MVSEQCKVYYTNSEEIEDRWGLLHTSDAATEIQLGDREVNERCDLASHSAATELEPECKG